MVDDKTIAYGANRGQPRHGRAGVLARLRGDSSGNTLALMAAALVPTIAAAGSAIDMSRYYMVRVRLQQACDAGVLAGRKFMDTSQAALDSNATTQAQRFFANNFTSGWVSTTDVSFAPSRSTSDNNVVTGTASASTPPVLMQFFGATPKVQTVTCSARFDVADSDVMFVLDTTGSMACGPADPDSCGQAQLSYTRSDGTTGYYVQEKSNSRLQALRDAVTLFYNTVQSNKDPSTYVRYGFVSYTSTVNVGGLLQPQWLDSNTYNYQTRRLVGDANSGSASNSSTTGVSQSDCNAQAGRTPGSGYNGSGTATVVTTTWNAGNGGSCARSSQVVVPNWQYGSFPIDVSQYVTGAAVQDPTRVTASLNKWQGCIEERIPQTGEPQGPFTDVNNLPASLDPDLVPTSDATRWRPMWPQVVWWRNAQPTWTSSSDPQVNLGNGNTTGNYGNPQFLQSGFSTCGTPAQRIKVMQPTDIQNYLYGQDFKAIGGTYHDIGMEWGLRLISPTGLFAADTAAWPGRNPPNRYIVFMTDGNMAPSQYIYGFSGLEMYDQRISGGSFGNLTNIHNNRLAAACAAAKARNIVVYAVVFGSTATLSTTMQNCASPGKAYYAPTTAQLQDTFKQIATQIAQLRLSQ